MPREECAARRCPECGFAHDARRPPRADWPLHWRRLAPALSVIAAVAAVVAHSLFNTTTAMSGSGTPRTTILDSPAFTFADVRAMAQRGGEAGNPLCRAIAARIERYTAVRQDEPGDLLVCAGFFTQRLDRRRAVMFGWPTPWCSRSEIARYQDAVKRSGFVPWTTNPTAELLGPDHFLPGVDYMSPQKRWSWVDHRMAIAHRPPVEETGGVKINVDVSVQSILAAIGLVVLAWGSVKSLVWLVNAALRRRKPPWQWRWPSAIAGLLMLTIVILMAVRSRAVMDEVTHFEMGRSARAPTGANYWVKSSVARIGLRGSDFHSLIHQPDGDQRAAQAILAACPSAAEAAYLGIELAPEALVAHGQYTSVGSTFRVLTLHRNQFVRRPDAGISEYMAIPPGERLDLRAGHLSWRSSSGDPAKPIVTRAIDLQRLGMLGAGLALFWLAINGACAVAHRAVIRRRVKRGCCANCGYILDGEPATAARGRASNHHAN